MVEAWSRRYSDVVDFYRTLLSPTTLFNSLWGKVSFARYPMRSTRMSVKMLTNVVSACVSHLSEAQLTATTRSEASVVVRKQSLCKGRYFDEVS